jgi:hypothetical protein
MVRIRTWIMIQRIGIDGDAHGFAAKEEPKDAEFPVLEGVDTGMRMRIEVEQRAGGDEGFAAAFAAGEEERNVGDLLGDGVDGAIDPDYLFVSVGEARRVRGRGIFASEPVQGLGRELGDGLSDGGGAAGEGDVEAEEVHGIFDF